MNIENIKKVLTSFEINNFILIFIKFLKKLGSLHFTSFLFYPSISIFEKIIKKNVKGINFEKIFENNENKLFVFLALISSSNIKLYSNLIDQLLFSQSPIINTEGLIFNSSNTNSLFKKRFSKRLLSHIKKGIYPSMFFNFNNELKIYEGFYYHWGISSYFDKIYKKAFLNDKFLHPYLNKVTILAIHTTAISFYSATAIILKKIGYDVSFVIHPKASLDGSPPNKIHQCLVENECRKLKQSLSNFGIKVHLLNDYYNGNSPKILKLNSFKEKKIKNVFLEDVTKQSIADVKTLFMTPSLNLNEKKIKETLKFRKLENFDFLLKFHSFVEKNDDSTNYLVDSGSWAEYGIAFKLLKKYKKNVTCLAFRNDKSSIVIGKNSPFTELDVDQIWLKYINNKLNQSEKIEAKKLRDTFSTSEFYKDKAYFNFQTEKIQSLQKLKQRINIENNNFNILILPNVAWDTTMLIEKPNIIFKDHTEWFLETINFLKDFKNINVIIRPHPAEKIFNCADNVNNLYKKNFEIENFYILDQLTSINTYGLVDACDLIIIYTSDIGWESTLRNKPVVSGGKGPSWGKNITYDSKSQNEYYSVIKRLIYNKCPKEELFQRKSLAEKFMLLYMVKIFHKFPFPIGSFWTPETDDLFNDILKNKEHSFKETFELLAKNSPNNKGLI